MTVLVVTRASDPVVVYGLRPVFDMKQPTLSLSLRVSLLLSISSRGIKFVLSRPLHGP